MRRFAIATLLAAFGAPVAVPPGPAVAQTVQEVCMFNNAPMILRAKFRYRDWQGVRHESAWTIAAFMQMNCVRLQDAAELVVVVEAADLLGTYRRICAPSIQSRLPRVTVRATGSLLNPGCDVAQ
jgi:hypothetical protein